MQNVQHSTGDALRAGVLDGSLRPRIIGLAESLPGPSWFTLMVETGKAWISDEDDMIEGPALVWRPWPETGRARLSAGATGSYIVIGSAALANAAGYMPETRELREAADRIVVAPLDGQPERTRYLRMAFHGLIRELGINEIAARAVVEAYLRVILVEAYRASQPGLAGSERLSPAHRVFSKFGEMVESHFRERWTVTEYARVLGMSRDRLSDICVKVRGLGPKELVDRRVTIEARLQLENSSHSVQQIADLLGFNSSSQFTRFFARTAGVPPGRYRAAFLRDQDTTESATSLPYEWP